MDRHDTETKLLDRMEQYLDALHEPNVAGYDFDGALTTIIRATTETVMADPFPEMWSQVYVEASHNDPDAWEFLRDLVREYRRRDVMPPAVLIQWALDVVAGIRTKPKRSRGRPSQANRDAVIVWTIRELHDKAGLPYESRDRRSACAAVAERSKQTPAIPAMSPEAVATIWRRRTV